MLTLIFLWALILAAFALATLTVLGIVYLFNAAIEGFMLARRMEKWDRR